MALGYPRNLEGIHDSYWALTARNWDGYGEILRARKARFVIPMAIPNILATFDQVLPELGEFGRVAAVEREGGKISARDEGRQTNRVPLFHVWRVMYPEGGR